MKIKETIVVEGRDDLINLRRFVESEILITRGFHFHPQTWKKLDFAYKKNNLIIFTDPDGAGKRIREVLTKRYPKAKHAFLSRKSAMKDGDIGIENASVEDLKEALEKVRSVSENTSEFTVRDLYSYGLIGTQSATAKRDALGAFLGVGYGNGKEFTKKLNHYGVTREELEKALKELGYE